MDCHQVSRDGVITPLEVLTLYKKCLPVGGIRERAYTTLVGRAQRNGRLPGEASAVLAEMKAKLRALIFETNFQREDRLEKEFEALQMGRMGHAEFRSLWEEKLDECLEAGVYRADEATYESRLKRKYLSKISAELRSTVLSKVWMLDGEEKPARKPNSWDEVARAIEIEMESRADARAPTDNINAYAEGEPALGRPTARCSFC